MRPPPPRSTPFPYTTLFRSQNQDVNLKTTDHVHPSTAHFEPTMTWFDELYNYRTNPRGQVHVLQELDEKDRKSTRLNSSHVAISYAVFCLKKKKKVSIQYVL